MEEQNTVWVGLRDDEGWMLQAGYLSSQLIFTVILISFLRECESLLSFHGDGLFPGSSALLVQVNSDGHEMIDWKCPVE